MMTYRPALGESFEEFTADRCQGLVEKALGQPGMPVEIVDRIHWQPAESVAAQFQVGRVFLVGDAAHTMPGYKGLGLNTAIGSAQNLAWKLAAVISGQAEAELLASYQVERHPVGVFAAHQSLTGPAAALLPQGTASDILATGSRRPVMLFGLEIPDMATSNMEGKVCLVTGASSGIGKVTASELADMGATVVMLCRNRAKGEAVQAEIKEASGNAHIDLLIADLSELSQVRRAATEFKEKYARLHVLINNAGGINAERKVTSDGLEATFVTDYLAPFLLTHLLLDVLKASAPARIVNVSAPAQRIGRINFADLQGARHYNALKAYTQAKLALLCFTYELAEYLKGTGVTVNALDPGHVVSHFNNSTRGLMHVIAEVIYFFDGISPERGAQTELYLATSPNVAHVSGEYFANCKPILSSKRSYDVAMRRRLWNVSISLAGLSKGS